MSGGLETIFALVLMLALVIGPLLRPPRSAVTTGGTMPARRPVGRAAMAVAGDAAANPPPAVAPAAMAARRLKPAFSGAIRIERPHRRPPAVARQVAAMIERYPDRSVAVVRGWLAENGG